MSRQFPEEDGYKYRYYTDEWRKSQGLTQDQMVNYIERATTWTVVGYDAPHGVTVCRRPISSAKHA